MSFRLVLLIPALLLALTGCTTTTQLTYEPQPLASKADAIAQLEQVLREQDGAFSAGMVDVTDKYFATTDRMTKYVSSFGKTSAAGASMQAGRYVYYDNIGTINFFERHKFHSSNKSYFVRVYDTVRYQIFVYSNHDESKARKFIDSIDTLQH